jgi:L-ascorbate metabolism protein UlaG (beta-lactamase superfamily)
MQIQLIRNATMKITLAGKTILTDPMLLPRHGIESFAGKERNPVVELPLPVEEILSGVNMVLVSHVHRDHFDDGARELLPKDIPIFCPPVFSDQIRQDGFTDVQAIEESIVWEGIRISRTPGIHAGNKKWQDILGPVSGFLFRADDAPVLYWPGDTILSEEVKSLIRNEQPDIILPHGCGAVLEDSGPIVMDGRMVIDICRLAPESRVVAIHMEALDHATVTRDNIRSLADAAGISDSRLIIPADGEMLSF